MAKGKKQSRGPKPQKANNNGKKKKIRDEDFDGDGNDNDDDSSSIGNPLNLALLCAVSSLMLYWNTHYCEFVYDDYTAIVSNYDVKGITPLSALWRNDFWGQVLASVGSHKSFRPLTVLSFRINHTLIGMNAGSFHLWNNVINAVTVFASVWAVIAVLGGRKQQQGSNNSYYALAVASILYTFHPIRTEAVANTVGRADLLGALLEFIAFWCHYRSMMRSSNNKIVTPYFLASLVLAFVSALAKEPCLLVLAICGTNEIASIWLPITYSKELSSSDRRKRLTPSVVRFSLLAFTGILYMLMRVIVNGESMEIKPSFKDNPLLFADSTTSFLLTALHIQALYAWKLVYPFNFSCDYGFDAIPMVESLGDARNIGTLVWAAMLVYLVFTGLRNARDKCDPRLLVALAWIVAPLLPASHIIPLGTVLAERLLYVPSLGYSILIGLAVERLLNNDKRKKQYLNAAVPLLVVVLAVFTNTIIHRNLDWRTNDTIWEANYASYPRNVKTATTHARVLEQEGDNNQAWHITKKAYEQLPDDMPNLIVYARTTAVSDAGGRDFAKAHSLLDEGITAKAGDYKLYSAKADLFRRENRLEEARSFHLKALEVLSPSDAREPAPHCSVGEIETLLGSWENSVKYMEKCVTLSKAASEDTDEQHLHRLDNLGKAYYMTKQWDKAEEIFLESTKHRENPDIQRLLDNLIKWRKSKED